MLSLMGLYDYFPLRRFWTQANPLASARMF